MCVSWRKISMAVDGDRVEDREWINGLVRLTADNVSSLKRRRKK